MEHIMNIPSAATMVGTACTSYIDHLYNKMDAIYTKHRLENPDLYDLIERRKIERNKKAETETATPDLSKIVEILHQCLATPAEELRGAALRAKSRESHAEIREHLATLNAEIIPRTQAHNRKCATQTIEEEIAHREEIITDQIRAWRSLLPSLIRKFSKIPDYRRVTHVKHKMIVLMMFGLFAFIFRLSSRREMNRELTSPIIFEHLKKLFPEIETIPHADTLARALEKINPQRIEEIHINLIKELINKKKFKKLLIHDALPISIDGTQKLYRDGLFHDERWCERQVGNAEDEKVQQYIYVIEANITLRNGLNIPLISEYLYTHNNQLLNTEDKQDNETTAFERMAARLKKYFPRLKMIYFMDAMYATQGVMGILHSNHWEFIIRLPKNKLKELAEILNAKKSTKQMIPEQSHYRKRQQEFYWENNLPYGYGLQLSISLIACLEKYELVNKKTGEIETHYSEHLWISSIPASIHNVHELLNEGARKKELIEDSINTEKNRGYRYKHAFSYNWTAMQGFHYLMRLAHAINAIAEFSKKMKSYIKSLGVSATLKLIKETIFGPWFPIEWYATQREISPQLRLQLE